MPSTKIAPSVLAADMGNLNAECKRMIEMGADWLHMGASDAIVKNLARSDWRSRNSSAPEISLLH